MKCPSLVVGVVLLLGVLSLGFNGAWAEEPSYKWRFVSEEEVAKTERPETTKPDSPKEKLPFRVEGEIELGGQTLSGDTNSPTLFEYRDLKGKPTIPHLRLKAEDMLRTRFLELGGTNMTRTDGFYFLRLGQYNTLQFDFDYNRQPHVLGLNRTTIFGEPTQGKFTLPTVAGQPVTATPFTPPPPPTPSCCSSPVTQQERNDVEAAVNALLRPTDLEFQTDTAHIGLRGLPLPNLELKAGYSRIARDGTMPFGGVIGNPGSNVVEFPAPREDRTHDVVASAEYAEDWYQARFQYDFSLYKNEVNQMEWDNVCGTLAPCGNPSGFGRASQLPDNHAHSFSGAGGITLPWWQARLTAAASYSLWRQNETFLPYTTISGFTGNTTDAGASSPDAKMNVTLVNLGFVGRPIQNVKTKLGYRYYQLDNETSVQSFTNTLSAGDTTPGMSVHTSEPIGYSKQNVNADVVWRIIPKLTAQAGYEWEHWDRINREVDTTNENIVKGALDLRPRRWVLGRIKYAHSVRTIGSGGYTPLGGNVVLPQFRKFTQADRTRDKGEFFFQASPLNKITNITLSGSFFAQQDNYFNTDFGVQDATAFGWSADAFWAPLSRLELFVGYAHDDYQNTQQNCQIPFGGPPTCNPNAIFSINPRDILDTFNTGLDLIAIPDRLYLSASYRYTYGRSKIGSGSVPGGTATPAPWPEITNVFHVINVAARYQLRPRWTLKLNYAYERYIESDFTTDTVTPSLANVSVDGFTTSSASDVRSVLIPLQHPDYDAHIVAFSARYSF